MFTRFRLHISHKVKVYYCSIGIEYTHKTIKNKENKGKKIRKVTCRDTSVNIGHRSQAFIPVFGKIASFMLN